jgi:hypothetical protein
MIRMWLRAEKSSKSEVSTDDAPINPSQFSNTTGQSHMLFYYNGYYYYCCCYCLKVYPAFRIMYMTGCCKSLRELIVLEKKEEKDPELDKMIAQLGVAEYQVNKLRRILDNRLDRSNPVVFSKGSSTYAFKSGGRKYRITIEADTFDTEERSTTHSIRNALKSPAFIITFTLFSAITCILALVSVYWSSPVLGTLSDRQLGILDAQYSLILDRCAALMDDDDGRPNNPRSFGAQYAVCTKAIIQLQEFCKLYNITACEDERIGRALSY